MADSFEEIVDKAADMLRRRGRVSRRALKRSFELDDETLSDLCHELVVGLRIAAEEDGEVLVLAGGAKAEVSVSGLELAPRSSALLDLSDPALAASRPSIDLSPIVESLRGDRASRRQITVLFADLVGSTELSGKLDPEDLRDLIGAYQTACHAEISRFDGHIAQYLGDGIVAYFGWPVAHEDAAERAVRAGLAAVEAVRSAGTVVSRRLGIKLAARVGVHSGVVVVGEIGEGEGKQNLAVGEAPNVAARVQSLAEPGSVIVSDTTAKLVSKRLELVSFATHRLKGVADPVALFRALGEISERGQTERRIVGREREVSLLSQAIAQARSGRGSVLILSGEAGIGKSRLLSAASELAGEDFDRLVFRCSPFHTNTALYPVTELLERRLAIDRSASLEERTTRVQLALARAGVTSPRAAATLVSLLGRGDALAGPSQSDLAQTRQETFDTIVAIFQAAAHRKPVLALWEDMHWSDATTIELVGILTRSVESAPVLHVVAQRPDRELPFAHAPGVVQTRISRFATADAAALVTSVLDGKRLSSELLVMVAEKTDGVPLYIEEVVKGLLEAGELEERDGTLVPKGTLDRLVVPSTLHDSLMARLDRMSSAREIAQLGATLGREFSYELLEATAGVKPDALRDCLEQLVAAELLFTVPGTDRYVFKHALIQDVAYQSLVRATKQRHHARIARALEERFPELAERQPEVVGHHYAMAQMPREAMLHLRRAGRRAVDQSAYVEALAHFSRALDELHTLPPSNERDRDELDLVIQRGVPLTATRGYGAHEVLESYARARELAHATGQDEKLFPPLYGLWRSSLLRAEYEPGRLLADQLLGMAEKLESPGFTVAARRTIASVAFYQADYARSVREMENVLAAPVHPAEVRVASAAYEVVDSFVTAHSYLAWATWMQGDPERARTESDVAVRMASVLEHGFTRALSLSFASWLHQFRRDVGATRACVEKALVISRDQGLTMWVGWGEVMRGWTLAEDGRFAEANASVRDGIATWLGTGSALGMSYFSTLQADVRARGGDLEGAFVSLETAEQFAERTSERFYLSETQRLRGELLHQSGAEVALVREALERALEISRAQGARLLELRAGSSLVRCLGPTYVGALSAALDALPAELNERDVIEARALVSC